MYLCCVLNDGKNTENAVTRFLSYMVCLTLIDELFSINTLNNVNRTHNGKSFIVTQASQITSHFSFIDKHVLTF